MSNPVFTTQNLRPKPSVINRLPGIGRNTGTVLYPKIYLSQPLYEDAMSARPSPNTIALILHEQEHLRRIKSTGAFKWYVRYILSRKFRVTEEIAAYKPQLLYLRKNSIVVDLDQKARVLSGWLYLWPITHAEAHRKLTEIWES